MSLTVHPFFEAASGSYSFIVANPESAICAIVDPALGLRDDQTVDTHCADLMLDWVDAQRFTVRWILETHVHADHLSAAPYLRDQIGGKVAIGARITEVQHTFGEIYNAEQGFRRDGSQFDQLFADGETFRIGELEAEYLSTPGHTPACGSYRVEDNIFVGDTLFMPDFGTARCDFPGGDARTLYKSIRRILDHHPQTTLWICHDYKAPGRDEFAWRTTVGAQRDANPHVRDGVSEDEFVAMREAKDAKLGPPKLLIPSIQVNMRAGDMPPAEDNGVTYLKVPVNVIGR